MESFPILANTTKFHSSFDVQDQKFDQLHVTNTGNRKLFLDKKSVTACIF